LNVVFVVPHNPEVYQGFATKKPQRFCRPGKEIRTLISARI
jgi:hypothetical protein